VKKEILYVLIAVALLLLLLAYFRSGSSDRRMESGKQSTPQRAGRSSQSYDAPERRDNLIPETPGRPAATPGRSGE
jgi:hypothetical protein